MKDNYNFHNIPNGIMRAIEETEKINRKLGPITELPKGSYISPLADAIELTKSPLVQSVENFQNQINPLKSAVETIAMPVANRVFIDNVTKGMGMALGNLVLPLKQLQSERVMQSMQNVVLQYADILESYHTTPIMEWINKVSLFPLFDWLDEIEETHKLNYELYYKAITKELYRSRWFPSAIYKNDLDMIEQINEVIAHTKESKNRTKEIDKIIISCYTKTALNKIKQQWKKLSLPRYKYRMICQAVQAYHRKEYALTIAILCTMWEDIIYKKANDTDRKISKRTKDNIAQLVEFNALNEHFYNYFDNYVFYQCKSEAQVKEDVPGRHGIAHGWYKNYPSRKEALNSILITDFLLNLEPLEPEKRQVLNVG